MPVNYALLVVYKALYLVQESITAVNLALNNNPSPAEALELNNHLSDLQTLKDELMAQRDGILNGNITMPSPDSTLIDQLAILISKVEQAANAGVAAGAVIALAGEALSMGLSVMSLAK